jgi:hypothetical protein
MFENRMLRRLRPGCRREAGEQNAEEIFENRILRRSLRTECRGEV